MKLLPPLLALLAAAPLVAQPTIPDRPITRAEVIAGIKRQFAAMDTNHDGAISPAEFDAYRQKTKDAPAANPFAHVGAHWFERADANQDGKVTLAEAQAHPLELFDGADLNHDGVIGPDERKMAMMLMNLRGK